MVALVGLNYNNFIIMHGLESVKFKWSVSRAL